MTEDFIYNKMTSAPSDYSCNDGDLSLAKNVVSKYNEIAPIQKPTTYQTFNNAVDVLYIHHTTNGDFYICSKTNENNALTIYAIDKDNKEYNISSNIGNKILGIKSIGNVLIVSTDTKLNYVRYKADTNSYLYLGEHIPSPVISFGLELELVKKAYPAHLSTHTSTSMQTQLQDFCTITSSDDSVTDKDNMYIKEAKLGKNFEANVEYYLSSRKITNLSYYIYQYINLYGVAEDGSYVIIIGKNTKWFRLGRTFKKYIFAANKNNVNLYDFSKCSINLYIKKGFENTIAGNIVEYTKDNFDALVGYREKFVSLYATKENKFIHPFFIRYALKLYDGSYVNASTPILMLPNSGYAPMMQFGEDTPADATYRAFIATLQYAVKTDIQKEWKDVVSSVDIFISSPLYPYDGGAEYDETKSYFSFIAKEKNSTGSYDLVNDANFGIGKCSVANNNDNYYKHNIVDISNKVYKDMGMSDESEYSIKFVKIAEEKIQDKIEHVSTFYLISSINFEDFTTNEIYNDVKIEKNALVNIEQNKTLKDDFYADKTFFDAHVETYNNRLHLYNYKYQLPAPTDIWLQNSHVYIDNDLSNRLKYIYVFIQTQDGEKLVKYEYENEPCLTNAFFFAYPDSRATKAFFVYTNKDNKQEKAIVRLLTKHKLLNMAYYITPDINEGFFHLSYDIDFSEDSYKNYTDHIQSINTILQSYSNMPFAFVDTASSIPCNKLIAIKPQCVALSQGQFGEFPLMAFTDNGIWALSINNEGLYVAKQATSREVPINEDAIQQLDKALVFITDRGVCLMSGSDTQYISEAIYENNTSLTDIKQFKEFIKACKMFYDYAHNRVIFYDNNLKYAYAYYLSHNSWCVIDIDINKALNSYPSALVISSDRTKVLNFSDEDTSTQTDFEVITRPLKLKTPNIFKTISLIIQRGYWDKKSEFKFVLYASNNLIDWTTVWASSKTFMNGFCGTPYKYYKIKLKGKLNSNDRLVGFTAQYEPKGTNKPR